MSSHEFSVHQEEDAVASRGPVRVALASFAIGAAGVFFAGVLLVWRIGTIQPTFAGTRGPRPAPTVLSGVEQTPIWDTRRGEELAARQRRELDVWGWVDKDAGTARIPIDRAMDIVAREPR
jgi:hypothetical protein